MAGIVKLLEEEGIEYRDKGKNVGSNSVNIKCLWCGEQRFHLGITPDKNVFHCWICGESGTIAKLIAKIKNISIFEAKDIFNSINRKYFKRYEKEDTKKFLTFSLPLYTIPIAGNEDNMWVRSALKFIERKYNLSLDQIKIANLHVCYFGRYRNTIVIPVYYKQKLVNFVCRTWDIKAKKRYINCHNDEAVYPIKDLVYNMDNVYGSKKIVVTEGVFDAIKVGLDKAVCLFGKIPSKRQLKLLSSLKPEEFIVMLDSDAYDKAVYISKYLSIFCKRSRAVKLPEGKDPAECDTQEIAKLIQ